MASYVLIYETRPYDYGYECFSAQSDENAIKKAAQRIAEGYYANDPLIFYRYLKVCDDLTRETEVEVEKQELMLKEKEEKKRQQQEEKEARALYEKLKKRFENK
jgi:hypothetical protein